MKASSNPSDSEPSALEADKPFDRRDALRFLLGAAASMALGACNSQTAPQTPVQQGPSYVPTPLETTDRKSPFLAQWNDAVAKGLKDFEASTNILGADGSQELASVIRNFDLGRYIDDLAKIADLPPEIVGGQIERFSVITPENPHSGTMAEVEEFRHLKLYVNEWMRYRGKLDAATVRAVLRHELAHMFSFDYTKKDRLEGRVPFAYQPQTRGWQEREQLSDHLYEGATEIVARMGSKAYGEGSREQGYRGGATLSAYVLSKLLGEKDFLRAYLTRDTRLLKHLFDEKVGPWAHQELTMPVVIGSMFFGTDSLDFLHQACAHPLIGPAKVESLLVAARQEGIPERLAHVTSDGCKMTTHLFQLNDADEPPRYSLNAVAEAPRVYRYGKIAESDGYRPTERFGIMLLDLAVSKKGMEIDVEEGVKSLKEHCSIKDPQSALLVGAFAAIGLDGHVVSKLAELDKLPADSPRFEAAWNGLNAYMVRQLTETVKTIYKRAGVENLIAKKVE